MINNIRLGSSDGGHGGKDSGDVELHLDGLIWFGCVLILELVGRR